MSGRFQWVECQLETLRKCLTPLAIRKALRSLPGSLDETYESIVANIDEQHIEDAVSILKCLVSSIRPLKLQELAEILAIDWENDEHFQPSHRMPDIYAIQSICRGLLTTVSPKETITAEDRVHLAHSSIRDFLVSKQRLTAARSPFALDEAEAHGFLAQSCLAYLLNITRQAKSVSKLKNEFPLAGYAAVHWIDHYRATKDKACVPELALQMFEKYKRVHLINWCELYNIDKPWLRHVGYRSSVEQGRDCIMPPWLAWKT